MEAVSSRLSVPEEMVTVRDYLVSHSLPSLTGQRLGAVVLRMKALGWKIHRQRVGTSFSSYVKEEPANLISLLRSLEDWIKNPSRRVRNSTPRKSRFGAKDAVHNKSEVVRLVQSVNRAYSKLINVLLDEVEILEEAYQQIRKLRKPDERVKRAFQKYLPEESASFLR